MIFDGRNNVGPEAGGVLAFRRAAATVWRNMKSAPIEGAVLLIIVGIIAYHVFVPPLIGLADSGDYGRIIAWRGLSHVPTEYDQKYFSYFNSKYLIIPKWPWPEWYLTSTSLLIETARWISITIGQDRLFDIRILAAINILIFVFGLWLILRAGRSLSPTLRIVLYCLLILIFTDVGYIAYFNSFYSEATALAFLAVGIGCSLNMFANRTSSIVLLIGYFLAVGMLVTSKPQYVPLVPALGLFGVYLSRGLRFKGKYWLSGLMAIALCCVGIWYLAQAPQIMRVQSAYVEIFMDLLPHSPTPQQDLAEMGLNPDYAAFSGTTPYQPDSPLNNPSFQAEFSERINSLTVPMFYLSHLDRFYDLCVRCAKYAFSTRVARLGYYEAHTGKKPLSQPSGVWSSIRENLFPRSVFFLAFFFATGLAAITFLIRTSAKPSKSLYFLYQLFIFTAIVQFFVPVLVGGGAPDLEKHLFMFNLAFDVCFILCVLWAVYTLETLRSSFLKPTPKE